MTAPATPTPPPGSPEAVALGCLCPVLDNAHGRGAALRDSTGRVQPNEPLYWVADACPLHGTRAQPDAGKAGRE